MKKILVVTLVLLLICVMMDNLVPMEYFFIKAEQSFDPCQNCIHKTYVIPKLTFLDLSPFWKNIFYI